MSLDAMCNVFLADVNRGRSKATGVNLSVVFNEERRCYVGAQRGTYTLGEDATIAPVNREQNSE
jgi:hypothetical protein